VTASPRRWTVVTRLLAAGIATAIFAGLIAAEVHAPAAPFGPRQADAELVGLRVLTPADALGSNVSAVLHRLGGSPDNNIEVPNRHRDWQYVVGRVDVTRQPAAHAEYDVIVVDNRLHRVVPSTYSYPEPGQAARAAQGWDPADTSLHDKYGWRPSGVDQAAFFPLVYPTRSFVFWARLAADTNPVADAHTDLSVVLALTNGVNHVYWSEKIN
jgi:hypothetical protein